MKKIFLMLLSVFGLASCGLSSSQNPVANTDIVSKPLILNCRELANEVLTQKKDLQSLILFLSQHTHTQPLSGCLDQNLRIHCENQQCSIQRLQEIL